VDVLNPSISNTDLANPSISNPSISNAAMQDTTWTVTNNGNAAGSFNVSLFLAQAAPNTVVTQLLVHRIYTTPVAESCALKQTTKTVLMANVPNPSFTTSGNPGTNSPTVPLAPGETIQLTIRVVDPNPPAPGVVSFQPAKAVKPMVIAQAVNTVDAANGVTQPSVAGGPMTITNTFLLNPVLGASYQALLHANGGYGAQTWSIVGGGLPPGLMLTSSSGVISGIATSLGLFNFIVQVQDSATPIDSATQALSLLVVSPLVITTTALPTGQVGQPYSAPVQATGGFGTLTWSLPTGSVLPPGLVLSSGTGIISGTPTSPGSFTFAVAVTDSNAPPQLVSKTFTVSVQASNSPTLTFVQQPTTTPAGQAIAPAVSLVAKDSTGAVLPGVAVTLALQTNPSGATLGGIGATTNASGIASFPALRVNRAGAGYTLRASATGFSGAISNAFNVTPVGVNLTFAVQPGLSTAGQSITPIVQVQVQDNFGSPLAGIGVTLALGTNPCSGALTGTTMVTSGPTGSAAFPSVAVTTGGAGYTLVASATGATPITSNPFTIIGFCATGSMAAPRLGGTITLLNSGQVLLAGGFDGSFHRVATATLYDPASGTFLPTGSMNVARDAATATLLSNGKALIAGGFDQNNVPTATAELYDPANATFTLTGSMASSHAAATATLLANGKVLIAGGSAVQFQNLTATAEIYDPASGMFSSTGSLNTAREFATATLLPNGSVLVTGGQNVNTNFNFVPLASAEIYDPSTGMFALTGPMTTPRVRHTATLLPNGKVLLAGGHKDFLPAIPVSSIEIYDPVAGSFNSAGNMLTQREDHSATLLPNGKVLLAGGSNGSGNNTITELFDSVAVSSTLTGSPIVARNEHRAVLLGTGNVLLAGGADSGANVLSSAELYLAPVAPPLTISTLGLPAGDLGQAYNASLNTNGGTGIVTWSRTAGALPPGLTLSGSGMISGTPTASGTFNFTVRATDSGTPPQVAYQPLSIQVLNTSAMLSFKVQPVAVVAGQVMVPPVQVKVQNSSGPIVGQTVTLALGNNPNGATLSGAIAVSGVGGLATFDMLSISTFGSGFTLVASAPGFAGVTSNAFNVLPAGATLSFVVQPSNTHPGQAITPAAQVRAADGMGLPISGVSVTLVLSSNPGASTLTGASAITNLSGIATFAALIVSNPGGAYALMATAPNFVAATSMAFNVTGTMPTLSFVVQPSNTTAGQGMVPAVQVLALDSTGAPISGVTVTLNFGANPCPLAAVGPVAAVTGANGIAVFPGLLGPGNHLGGVGFTAVASSPGATSATSNPFNITGFCPTGSMTTSRWFHTMTRLPNGKVLVTGGDDNSTGVAMASAELYDPTTGMFTPTGSMNVARDEHTATLLPNGKVLIAGGEDANLNPLSSAELYDPSTGIFTPTGNMNVAHGLHTATLLPNGKVLIAGGFSTVFPANAELYDPSKGLFTPSANPMFRGGRLDHVAVLLNNGTVLLAGGGGGGQTAEIYNPVTDSFSRTGNLSTRRAFAAAALLPNGKVLVASGFASGQINVTADLYDSGTGTFTPTDITRDSHNGGIGLLLPSGEALIAGGRDGHGIRNALADLYNATTGRFRPTADMNDARGQAAFALLQNGQTLISGGADNTVGVVATAELYVSSMGIITLALPDGNTSLPYSATLQAAGGTGNLTWSLTSGSLPPGLVLSSAGAISGTPTIAGTFNFTVGVSDSGTPVQTDSKGLSIRVSAAVAGASLSVVVQPTNDESGLAITPSVAVLAQTSGGPVGGLAVALAIGTNPSGGTLSGTTAVTSPSGIAVFPGLSIDNIGPGYTLVASATGFPGAISNPFDVVPVTPFLSFLTQPQSGTSDPFFLAPFQVKAVNRNGAPVMGIHVVANVGSNPCFAFGGGAAITDPSGVANIANTFITGGGPGFTLVAAAARGASVTSNPFNVVGFCDSSSLNTPRWEARSTLLPSGKVLVSGGATNTVASPSITNTAEVYDPATDLFTPTGNMSSPRFGHTSTLLPSGLVLIVGGSSGTAAVNTAELYDPTSGTFSPTGSMATARQFHRATLLPNGKVLITGGSAGNNTAELYDPGSGTFSPTGNMSGPRIHHTATLLANGKVLLVGGNDGATTNLNTAELYDPVAGTFAPTGSMVGARNYHTATLLPNGKVLVAGGSGIVAANSPLNTAEIYDPSSGMFAATGNMTSPRLGHTATLLASGMVLIIGHDFGNSEVYDPKSGSFALAGAAFTFYNTQFFHIAEMLNSGNVLIAGGTDGFSAIFDAGQYYPFAGVPLKVTTVTLADGNVGQPYNATLQANGGTGALSWSVIAGALPAGLTMNSAGMISGTPTNPGPNGFTAQVTDSGSPPMTAMQPLSITVANSPGAGLSFTVQPASTIVGQVISPAVQVLVQNSSGPVVGQLVTLVVGNNPGGAVQFGPNAVVSGAGGIATFSGVSLNAPGMGYTLGAKATGFTGATSTPFDVAPVGANLAFLLQPSNGVAGQALVPAVQVRASDGSGNGVAGLTITLAIGANPGGATLSGSTATTNLAGIATFSNLSLNNAGNGYTLVASMFNFTGATSNPFNILPQALTVAFLNNNARITAGQTVSPPPQVLVTNSLGPVQGVTVTISLIASPCPGATGQGTPTATTNGFGIATFTNVSVSNGGWGYVAQASALGVSSPINNPNGAQSNQFNVAGYCNSGTMSTPRRFSTATLLPNGLVLIAGGDPNTVQSGTASAELYNPLTRSYSATGNMNVARAGATATLLPNGKVLIAGGRGPAAGPNAVLTSAELYDLATGNFTLTGSMSVGRQNHQATLLSNGKVLITGGYPGPASLPYPTGTTSAEIYDPATGLFTPAGSMNVARANHAAVLLPSGKVLIVGGQSDPSTYLSSAELYDPAANTFAPTGSMATARRGLTASLLPSGTVLVAGGFNGTGTLNSAEVYNPAADTFSATNAMTTSRQFHSAVVLPSGLVLLTQGFASSSELYNPVSGTFTQTGSQSTPRTGDAVALLPDGSVLDAGGTDNVTSNVDSISEVYFPQQPPFGHSLFGSTGSTGQIRKSRPTATVLPTGAVLLAGGENFSTSFSSAELYNLVTGTFSPSAGTMSNQRAFPSATLLPNGKVLVAGGRDFALTAWSSADLYDPATDTFTPTGSMKVARVSQAATLLANGKVLVTGGEVVGSPTAELYDPAAASFSFTGSPTVARQRPTATLLPNGKVLVVGQGNGTAELYDPSTGMFSSTGSLSKSRDFATATLLPNGKVLVAGGFVFVGSNPVAFSTAELYDPATGVFTLTGSMGTARFGHTATLLPNGKVLIAGGTDGISSTFSTAEVYDPTTGLFSPAGNMAVPRAQFAATLLPSGTVLTVGGSGDMTADLFGPGPSSRLPQYSCSLESSLRSLVGTQTAPILFQNASGSTRNVYWLNYSGVRQLYNTLSPGQSFVQQTFLTHPWVTTDASNTCQAIFLPTLESGVAVIP
jgi:WD40 repeat protein